MTRTSVEPRSNGKVPAASSRAEAVDRVVARYNRDYALLLLGDRPVVMYEGRGADDHERLHLFSVQGFKEWNRPDVVWYGENEERRHVQAANLWLESDRRRQFNGLVFDPSSRAPSSFYNLWRGFAVEPSPDPSGEGCARFLTHLLNNVCSGDPDLFRWVAGWFAALVQHPTRKTGTSLVLRGTQGTGKTIVGRIIGSLLGQHYALVADARYLVGRFNSHLANCLLLQLDEATWGGNHDAAGKLKDLVTGDVQQIEYKGREPITVKNYVRLLITGNHRWLVPAGLEERRFAVIDVGESSRQDHSYFQAIEDEAEDGGREALLAFLLGFDLSKTNVRTIPRTAALEEQQLASLDDEQAWWNDILTRGQLPGDVTGEGRASIDNLYKHYVAHLERMGRRRKMSEAQWGAALRKLVPGVQRTRPRILKPSGRTEREYRYEFPPLATCRKDFGATWAEAQLAETWEEAPASSS